MTVVLKLFNVCAEAVLPRGTSFFHQECRQPWTGLCWRGLCSRQSTMHRRPNTATAVISCAISLKGRRRCVHVFLAVAGPNQSLSRRGICKVCFLKRQQLFPTFMLIIFCAYRVASTRVQRFSRSMRRRKCQLWALRVTCGLCDDALFRGGKKGVRTR